MPFLATITGDYSRQKCVPFRAPIVAVASNCSRRSSRSPFPALSVAVSGDCGCRKTATFASVFGDYSCQISNKLSFRERQKLRFAVSNSKPIIQFDSKWKTTICTVLVELIHQ